MFTGTNSSLALKQSMKLTRGSLIRVAWKNVKDNVYRAYMKGTQIPRNFGKLGILLISSSRIWKVPLEKRILNMR